MSLCLSLSPSCPLCPLVASSRLSLIISSFFPLHYFLMIPVQFLTTRRSPPHLSSHPCLVHSCVSLLLLSFLGTLIQSVCDSYLLPASFTPFPSHHSSVSPPHSLNILSISLSFPRCLSALLTAVFSRFFFSLPVLLYPWLPSHHLSFALSFNTSRFLF